MYRDVEPLADAPPDPRTPAETRRRVSALYQAHALGLVKLAKIMLGDQAAAEDVVQDAFLGLYRKWPLLEDQDRALGYLRASVLNGCRAAHRSRSRRDRALFLAPRAPDIASAEESALIGEANREVITDRGPFLGLETAPRTWYLLKVRPGATPVTTMTRLSFPLPSAADINGIALSPDGTKLAIFYQTAGKSVGFPYSGPFTLGIYSVATGAALSTWTDANPSHGSYGYGSDEVPDPNANLTWTSNGQRLAFVYRNSVGPGASLYLREVNVAGPGGGLLTDSTMAATIAASTATGKSTIWCDSLGITGDGRSAVCGAELPATPPVGATLDALTEPARGLTGCYAPNYLGYGGLAVISLAGDRLTRVLYEDKPKCSAAGNASVLWSSPSGGTVLGVVRYTADDSPATGHSAIVLYRQGTVTTVGWPGAAGTLLANEVAF